LAFTKSIQTAITSENYTEKTIQSQVIKSPQRLVTYFQKYKLGYILRTTKQRNKIELETLLQNRLAHPFPYERKITVNGEIFIKISSMAIPSSVGFQMLEGLQGQNLTWRLLLQNITQFMDINLNIRTKVNFQILFTRKCTTQAYF
jgi:hypothetical protein